MLPQETFNHFTEISDSIKQDQSRLVSLLVMLLLLDIEVEQLDLNSIRVIFKTHVNRGISGASQSLQADLHNALVSLDRGRPLVLEVILMLTQDLHHFEYASLPFPCVLYVLSARTLYA